MANRVLVYCPNYLPEKTGVGRVQGELVASFINHGYEVVVVCAPPHYPNWAVFPGYSNLKYEVSGANPKVIRVPCFIPRTPTFLGRLFYLASFAFFSFPVILYYVTSRRYKRVFTVEPSLVCSIVLWPFSLLGLCKVWLHIQDLEVDLGFKLKNKAQLFFKLFKRMERMLLRRSHRISIISKSMETKLHSEGVPHQMIYFPNWVRDPYSSLLPTVEQAKKDMGWDPAKFTVLFSGSFGAKYDLKLILRIAQRLEQHPGGQLIFSSDSCLDEERFKPLFAMKNVMKTPLCAAEQLPTLFRAADLHLLPQVPVASSLALASRILMMMASARPILASMGEDPVLYSLISRCGIPVADLESTAWEDALDQFVRDRSFGTSLGQSGRDFCLKNFSENYVTGLFFSEFAEFVK